MSILQSAQARYATKAFDANKPLTEAQINTLKEVIRLSPSSINIQTWRFLLATSDEAKAKVAEACPGPMAYNAKKIKEAPLVMIFCARTEVNEADVNAVVEQENADGRYADEAAKHARIELLTNYINHLNQDPVKARNWIDKQTYIALGQVLLAAADMGIDSVPIEGFQPEVIDDLFNLPAKGYHSTVITAFGYRSDDDFNAKLPKSRFSSNELFTEL